MERRILRNKLYYRFLYSVWKETTLKPSKVASAKNLFSSVYALLPQLVLMNAFSSMWYLADAISYEGLSLLWVFSTAVLLHSLKQVFGKKSIFHKVHYCQDNIAILISKVQNKASVYFTVKFSQRILCLITFLHYFV